MRARTFLSAALALALGLEPTLAKAVCNLIPVAREAHSFPSQRGSIVDPVTGPGRTVWLEAKSCDPEFFHSDDKVSIHFPGHAPKPASGVQVTECNGVDCRYLGFSTPDTGLAGPARIEVRRQSTGALVAKIEELGLPQTGCDESAKDGLAFSRFVVLPKTNAFGTVMATAEAKLLATIDGRGNLLVPLRYESVLSDETMAGVFLQGWLDLPTKPGESTKNLRKLIGNHEKRNDFIESFTLDGRPLPPLMRLTAGDESRLLGVADAPASVLRLSSKAGFDVEHLAVNGQIIEIPPGDFELSKHDVLPLKSLRASPATVAYTRSEALEESDWNGDGDKLDDFVQILDAATGFPNGRSDTKRQVVDIPGSPFLTPEITVRDDWVTFIETPKAGQHFLRAYDRTGAELLANKSLAVERELVIDRRATGISGERGFFRAPEEKGPVIVALALERDELHTTRLWARSGSLAGNQGRAALRVPESQVGEVLNGDSDMDDDVLQIWDTPGFLSAFSRFFDLAWVPTRNIGLAANRVSATNDFVALGVPEAGQGGGSLNQDTDTSDEVLAAGPLDGKPKNLEMVTDELQAAEDAKGPLLVFVTPEAGEPANGKGCSAAAGACDLNGDGDGLDRVARVYNPATKKTGLTNLAVRDALIQSRQDGGKRVVGLALPVREKDQNAEDRNGDLDTDDDVMHVVWNARKPQSGSGNTILAVENTGFAADPCTLPFCPRTQPYFFKRGTLWFLSDETDVGRDLDGNGFDDDVVLVGYRRYGKAQILSTALADPARAIAAGAGSIQLASLSENDPVAFSLPLDEARLGDLCPRALRSSGSCDWDQDGAAGNVVFSTAYDSDEDGVLDDFDNCPLGNPLQVDYDEDGMGASCDPQPAGCPPAPIAGCEAATLGRLEWADGAAGAEFSWDWSGAGSRERLGDPLTGEAQVSICVWPGPTTPESEPVLLEAALPQAALSPSECGAAPCWSEDATGLHYRNDQPKKGSLRSLSFTSLPGQLQVEVRAFGPELTPPPPAFLRPVVQLVVNEGERRECWQALEP